MKPDRRDAFLPPSPPTGAAPPRSLFRSILTSPMLSLKRLVPRGAQSSSTAPVAYPALPLLCLLT
eukprot:scaffold7906_cov30-Tisochrysis_lutea.AAC.2